MKPKEKLLNKTKINNSKFPLPKIKFSAHNNSNSQKIKSASRHFPKFHNNNHNNNIEQFDIIQPNIYKSKEPKKEEQKFNYKANLKIRNIYEQKNIYKNNNNTKNNELKINQSNLKYILKQFGLSEYLRKLYEFGYDNNNYLKIGTLSRKNFNNLLNNIHIFPGHTVKMEKFYEYLKKLNSNNNNGSYNYNYKKRKLNYNSIYGINNGNNVNKNNIYNNNNKQSLNVGNKNKKCLSPRGRPKTSHVKGFSKPKIRIRNNYSGNKLMKKKILNNSEDDNNILIKSYLNDNRKFILKNNNKNNIENIYIYNNKEKNKDEYNILYNSCSNYNNNKEYEDKMNQNIERMLNYYMVQLNDKLDNSYETVEDSSLSYIVTSQINENHNDTNNNKENKVIPNYKLPSINNNNKSKADKRLEIESIKKENKLDANDKLNKEKEIKKIIVEKETKNKSIKDNEEMKIKEEKKELIEEEVKKEANKTKEIKEEYKKDLKRFSDQEVSTKSKDSKEHEIEEDDILLLKEKEKKPIINNPINLKDNNNNLINNKNKKDSLLDDSYLLNEKYSLEQNIYETLRLNKSMDSENTNKDTLKFDIEFMCRCLALALMKHIEQGKEKMHITDLYPIIPNNSTENKKPKLNFCFFNQSFNQNMNLLTEFFCEKNNDQGNLGDLNMRSILERFCLENGDIDNDDIDLMKHIKKKGDEKIIEKENKSYHINGLYDMENEMKFIGELFTYSRKKSKNYQDLSENTKKILCKDLSYIKEIDSELNKTNNSKSNISKSNNNSNINKIENDEKDNDKENDKDNISKEDSKNNNENKTKIIDEEGKDDDDDDYNFNEDDFINEININDNDNDNKKENINNDYQNDKNDIKIAENETKKEENDIKVKNNSINNNDKVEEESKKVEELNKNDLNKININENLNINSLIKNSEKNEEKKPDLDIELSYIIDAENMIKFKEYLLKQFEIFDDDYLYYTMTIPARRFMPAPDPQSIFEFCANIMILTKMEKEVIIISLIYIERLIFNTGFIINSRNWRKIIFIALIIASKIWDDDSLENIHYSQVFTHLKIGEINLLERTFLELINYKIFVKFSEYIKYYFAIKNLALKYNFNGEKIVPVSVEKMMKIQEYAYQMQKRMRRKVSLNNSSHF